MCTRGLWNGIVISTFCVVFFIACNVFDEDLVSSKDGVKIGSETGTNDPSAQDASIIQDSRVIDDSGLTSDTSLLTDSGPRVEDSGLTVDSGDEAEGGGHDGTIGDSAAGDSGDSGRTELPPGCGDGRVVPPEKCDLVISKGNPGYCPRSQEDCPTSGTCVVWRRVGEPETCSAECKLFVPDCVDGDGCCPSNCDSDNDADCSAFCGNGIVEKENFEVCEPLSAFPEGSSPDPSLVCPESCPEDSDPCIEEFESGSPNNCNFTCEKVKITKLENGDRCCPDGANANTDSDCDPVCGNGFREGDEECDSKEIIGCNDQCKYTLTEEQRRCVSEYGDDYNSDECNICMCTNCYAEVVDCYGSDDPVKNKACDDIIFCGYDSSCIDTVCYCGTASIWSCMFNPSAPNGPCVDVIREAAGGTDNAFDIFNMGTDTTTALGRAGAISACNSQHCLTECTKIE